MGKFAYAMLWLLSLGVAGYAAIAYSVIPLGALVHPDMKLNFIEHRSGIYAHIFAALTALALGPAQFSRRLRQRYVTLHRWTGRIYLGIGVLVGGLAGLYMAQFAFGGIAARLGLGLLAAAWLYTGWRAYLAVRRGDITNHRRWMVRNFALTLAAVTLRIYLPASMAAGIGFDVSYPWVAWLAWIPNLFVAEWLLRRTNAVR